MTAPATATAFRVSATITLRGGENYEARVREIAAELSVHPEDLFGALRSAAFEPHEVTVDGYRITAMCGEDRHCVFTIAPIEGGCMRGVKGKTRRATMADLAREVERLRARKYGGFAGHLIVADSCRFHLTTDVGDYRVSTVGAYCQPGKTGWATIGAGKDSLFETLVFRLAAEICTCGCGERLIANWIEIEGVRAATPAEATENHEAMLVKYERTRPVAV